MTLQVSTEVAPPGGFAQIKVWLAAPALIAQGSISIDFDQAVFDDISGLAVFSAAGDAIGYANVNGHHLDAHFSSPSGSIGQSPNLPVMAVRIPVFVGAPVGTISTITLDPTGSAWKDPQGNEYAVTVSLARFTVGGFLSVESVTPGGGMLPAGTVLQIRGTGFGPTTAVSIDGVSISSIESVNPGQINVTLAAAAEMSGKCFRLANSPFSQIDYFSALPSAPGNSVRPLPGVHPIVPLVTQTTARIYNNLVNHPSITDGIALLNQNLTPVTVEMIFSCPCAPSVQETVTIPASTLYFLNVNSLVNPGASGGELSMIASAPIGWLEYVYNPGNIGYGEPAQVSVFSPESISGPLPPVELSVSSSAVSWSWQIGTRLPVGSIDIVGDLAFTTSVSTAGGEWLNVTPRQATAPTALTLTPNVSSLGPGTYTGTLTVTPVLPAALPGLSVQPTTISVSLTVSALPMISGSPSAGVYFQVPVAGGPPFLNPQTLIVASNGVPATFSTTVISISGGNWLSVTPLSGTTPATLTLTANTAGLGPGSYSAQLTVQGPANTLTIPVSLTVFGGASPPGLSFFLESGASTPASTELLSVQPTGASITASVQTQSGGDWLTAVVSSNAPDPPAVRVTASAAELAAGTYQGTVTITSSSYGSLQVPVTLTVWNPPPPQTTVTVSPTSVSLTAQSGKLGSSQNVTVDSSGAPIVFTIQGATIWSASYMSPDGQAKTPATLMVRGDATNLPPGVYHWNVVITWTDGSVTVPVTLTVTAEAVEARSPRIYAVVNAASQARGAISPGEIITIYGDALAPSPAVFTLDASGKAPTKLNGTEVLIGGVPVPLIYVSSGQVNAIVPYEVGTSGTATISAESNGVQSIGLASVSLAPSAPALFTMSMTGQGQAAVLNEDNTVNAQSNPAARGSVIQIFATGEGETSPPGVTGSVTHSDLKTPVLPVSVTIGGVDAPVQYKGSAPESVAGLFQVNALVPQAVKPGSSVPIVLTVGDARSQDRATIAVK